MMSGMYEQSPVDKHLANFHCNLTANVWLSHFFYTRLLAKGLPGCIVFTSSSAGFIPTPYHAWGGAGRIEWRSTCLTVG